MDDEQAGDGSAEFEVIGWRGLRRRASATAASPPDGRDDASGLTERDERALQAIRRQLDIDYAWAPARAEPAPADAETRETAPADVDDPGRRRRSPHRAWRIPTVAARVLMWLTAGALVTVLYVTNAGSPRRDDRRPPRPEGTGREAAPVAPAHPAPPPTSPLVQSDAPGSLSSVAASPARPRDSGIPRPAVRPAATVYWVQVGAFRSADSAARLASRLRQTGVTGRARPVRVLPAVPGVTDLTRVRVGPFADRRAAVAALRALRARGYEPAIAEDRG